MVAAVLIMLISSRKSNPVPEIAGLNIIAGSGDPAARDHRVGPA